MVNLHRCDTFYLAYKSIRVESDWTCSLLFLGINQPGWDFSVMWWRKHRVHNLIYATMKVSLLSDSRGNPANRPPLCIDCVMWRASQKCPSAQFFSSSSSRFLCYLRARHLNWCAFTNTALSCTYYRINASFGHLPVRVLNIFLVVSGASVIYNL